MRLAWIECGALIDSIEEEEDARAERSVLDRQGGRFDADY